MTDAQIACLGALDRGAAEFEIIWDIYPKRVARQDGLEAYNARRKEGVRFRVLLSATRQYKEERRGEDKKFTMGPKTFFGTKRRYLDYDGETNGETERRDGQWAPPMTRDLQALAREQESPQATPGEPTTDPDQTERSVEDRMSDL